MQCHSVTDSRLNQPVLDWQPWRHQHYMILMIPVGTYLIMCSSHFWEVMILLPQFSKCRISTSWKVKRTWPKQHYICPLVISWALPVAEHCLSSIGAGPLPYILCVSVTGQSSTQIRKVDQPLGRMTIWEDCHFSAAGISICLPGDWLGLFDVFRGHLIFHGSLSDSCLLLCPPPFLAVSFELRSHCRPS